MNFNNIILKKYVIEHELTSDYFIIEARKGLYRVSVYERYVDNVLRNYSYVLLIEDKRVLGYNNAPHYPHIRAYPHYKHVVDGLRNILWRRCVD